MDMSAALSAINSGDMLKQYVGLSLMSKVKDTQAGQANMLLQDFAISQKQIAASVSPHLGQSIDVSV
ncbi:hypothetical protein D3C73_1352380 [compost metagenome]